MVLKGHVTRGVICIDNDVSLPEGTEVCILTLTEKKDDSDFLALRGSVIHFPDPFASGLPEEEWDVLH